MPKKNAIDIDYSKDFEIAYKEIREKAEKGMLSIALEELFSWEKKTRSGGDFTTCGQIAREIVKICKDFNEWKQLNESLLLLSKRRGQATTVIAEAVKQGMEFIQQRDENTMELIKTLRTISEGKMYLEIESAELTRTLAKYQEQDGDIKLAAKTLQETQVETLAKMGKDKKIDYILEQVRLCLDAKDFTRAIIIGRKINTNNIAQDDALNPLKIRYYTLMIRYHYQEKDYLSIAKAYQAIYNTASVLADESEWTKYLKLTSIYAILSPYGNEQNDLINRTFLLKNLKEIPTFRALVKLFLTYELIRFDDIVARFLPELNEFSEFSEAERDILHLRVCEHVCFFFSFLKYH